MQDNAQEILDNGRKSNIELPMVQEAILKLRNDVVEKLLKAKDDQERKNLVESLQIAKEVVEYLLLTINKAEHATNTLDKIQKVGKKTGILHAFRP